MIRTKLTRLSIIMVALMLVFSQEGMSKSCDIQEAMDYLPLQGMCKEWPYEEVGSSKQECQQCVYYLIGICRFSLHRNMSDKEKSDLEYKCNKLQSTKKLNKTSKAKK